MTFTTVLRALFVLIAVIAGFMIIPAGIALYNGNMTDFTAFVWPIVGMLLLSAAGSLILRKQHTTALTARSGFIMVSLSWIIAAVCGALPFTISGAIPSYTDAFFETMSGFTTTGASILTGIESLSDAMLFWRSLTHWLGGMGIVVLTVAILPVLGIGGLQLLRAEAPGPSVDKITPRITETAKALWFIYIGMTAAETLLLMIGGMSLFDALTHTFGTLATGGFSPKNASVGHYDSAFIQAVITVFMVLAGVNFAMHYRLLIGNIRDVWRDTEIKVYFAVFFIATAVIAIDLYSSSVYDSAGRALQYSSFQAASILTTTGYATTDFEAWPSVAKIVLFTLMFIGGCSGSTGGGMKVIRIVTLFKQGVHEMKYLVSPRGVFSLRISGKPVRKDMVYAISGFVFLYIMMLLITTVIVATSDQTILTSFSTALVTVGNIGPGFGRIGPTDNYAFYPDYVKWFLSFAMMVGRLEVYTVLVLFTPMFWKR